DGTADSNIATVNITRTCLFCDDFNDGVFPTGWTIVKNGWTETGGNLVGTPTGKKAVIVGTPIFSGGQTCSVQTTLATTGGLGSRTWLLTHWTSKQNTTELLFKE